jgi:gliding motility-associated-like protein
MLKWLRHIIIGVFLVFTAGKTVAQNAMPDTVCLGTVRTYSVNDPSVPSTYTWKINGVTQTATANSISITWGTAGTFTLTVQERSAAGCYGDIQSGSIYVLPLSHIIIDTSVCANVFPYLWNGINITGAGNYDYVSPGYFGCDSTTTLNVITRPISTSLTKDTICANQVPYLWNGNSYTAAGTYAVTLTNSVNCDSIASLQLYLKPIPLFVINQPAPACAPATVNLTDPAITAGSDVGLVLTYWMDPAATIPLVNPASVSVTGTYYVNALAPNGCSVTRPVAVNVLIFAYIGGVRYTTINAVMNSPTQLNARSLGVSYSWSPPNGLSSSTIQNPFYNYDRQTEYRISITRDNGCITIDTLLVKVIAAVPPVVKSDLFVPRAWSPNNDGHNDKLFPLTVDIKELKYFRVFNRWGQLVFETNSIGKGWDGIFNGKPQMIDSYSWTAEAIGEDGKTIRKSGSSLLIR